MQQTKHIAGRYEADQNILHLWHPNPIILNSAALLEEFFKEVALWIKSCPTRPYLLVNYTNVEISVDLTAEYAQQVKNYHPFVLGAFRYGVSEDLAGRFTAMTIRMGHMRIATTSNLFPDELSARQAIALVRQSNLPVK
jgi:hypothetical protein